MKPDDVYQNQGDMKFYRDYNVNGAMLAVPICEDCWQEVPRYLDFPKGLVSPESDGDAGGNFAKTRIKAIGPSKDNGEAQMGLEHLQKVVCLDCYREAFARVYHGYPFPNLRGDYTVQKPEVIVEHPTAVVGSA